MGLNDIIIYFYLGLFRRGHYLILTLSPLIHLNLILTLSPLMHLNLILTLSPHAFESDFNPFSSHAFESAINLFSSHQLIGMALVTGRTWGEQSALNWCRICCMHLSHITPSSLTSISCTVFVCYPLGLSMLHSSAFGGVILAPQ